MSHIRIQLLGDFRIIDNDQPQPCTPQMRQQGLLAYVLVHRQAPLPRRRLAFLFWPDSGDKQARTNLRTALVRLQRELPWLHRAVVSDHHSLQWAADDGCSVDVAEFEAALQQAEQARQVGAEGGVITALRTAVALYTGDFLPHFYDDWVLATQERLRNHYLDALEWLITLLRAEGDYATAIDYAQQLAAYDPLSESACRHLIELHALHEDRAAAVRVYRTFARRLLQELGVEPSHATQALYQRVLAADAPLRSRPLPEQGALLTRFVTRWQAPGPTLPLPSSSVAGLLKLTAILIEQGCWVAATSQLDLLEARPLTWPDRCWLAEIQRLRGLLAWRRQAPAPQVEAHLRRAVAVAQQEQAHFLLLRAALTLVGYQQEHDSGLDPHAHLRALSGELGELLQGFSWPEIQQLGKLLA